MALAFRIHVVRIKSLIDSKPLLSDTTISFLQLFNFITIIAVNTCNVYVEHADVNREIRIDSVGSLESPV